MHDYDMGFGFNEAVEEYAGGVTITMDPAKRIDVIIGQIFPMVALKAEECYDCADYATNRLKRNYDKGRELIADIAPADIEYYSQKLDEAFAAHTDMIENSRQKNLMLETRGRTRLETGGAMNYENPVEIAGKSKTPYQFDGRECGVLFRNYKKIVDVDDVKMIYEASNDCLEDVLMKAVMLTPEAEALAERLGILFEYHPPEYFETSEKNAR